MNAARAVLAPAVEAVATPAGPASSPSAPSPGAPIQPITPAPARAAHSVSVGYLRAFVTLLVLAHHAVLAYHPYAPPPPASLLAQPRLWPAFPIVDSQRWAGFSLLVGYNDVFFMSLMFFLSGLFLWSSLVRKGAAGFLRDRAVRLGLPFVVAAAVVAPLAYYPAYLQTRAGGGFAGFWRQWRSLGDWPAGPAWFLWVLLAFGILAALAYRLLPRWGEALGRLASSACRRPAAFFWLLVAASAVAYIPLSLAVGPIGWTSFGPFFFQTSRILHYGIYLLAGAAVGAYGIERGLLAADGKLARRWPLWLLASLASFVLAIAVLIAATVGPKPAGAAAPSTWGTLGGLSFVLCCAASSFAFLALFARFAKKPHRALDSLRDNAYGMYLLHYLFVTWLQLALLSAPLSGLAKGTIAFLGTVALSWTTTSLLRRIPAVRRVI